MAWMQDLLASLYPWTVVLHVVSAFAWMAGLFYLPRLFVHHVERGRDNAETAELFRMMERKLLRLIMNPAMIATWIFGLSLVATPGIIDWSEGWPWVKAGAVLLMTWFHHAAARWRKELLGDAVARTGRFFRLMNEAPTVLLIVIVAMVIGRPF